MDNVDKLLKYTPPFHLTDRFIDANDREFEITETHWGKPGVELEEINIKFTFSTTLGDIVYYNAPSDSVLLAVVLKRTPTQSSRKNFKTVEWLQEKLEKKELIKTN